MKTHPTLSFLMPLCALLLSGAAIAGPSAQNTNVEVVQSVPVETTLAVPGLRMAQDVWIEMIRGAQLTLDLEQFYVSDQAGQALESVIQEIQTAAHRGVRVRLLVDKKMDVTYPDSVAQIGKFAHAESRTIDFSSLGGIQHAKFFVVDGKSAFLGSQNFDWRALNQIHEIGLRISDARIAADLSSVFERDWAAGARVAQGPQPIALTATQAQTAANQSSSFSTSSGLTVVASPSQVNPQGMQDSASAIVALMKSARHSISIQVMEYTTSVFGQNGAHWRVLDDAIRQAAATGVHVQLMLDADSAKKAKSDLHSLATVANVQVKSVTIPQWSGGKIDYARLIHSKYVVVDGNDASSAQGWVGSENWSQGYFTDSRDVGLIVSDPSVAGQLNQVFTRVWTSSYAATVQ